MQLMKKIFNAILILFGICVMVVLFAFAIMMIFHVSMFGYTYVSYKNGTELQASFDVNNLKTIDVSTAKVDIIVEYDTSTGITEGRLNTIADFQGILKDDVKTISYVNTPAVDENGVLKIETIEPEGWYFKNSSYIRILLPNNKDIDSIIVDTGAKNVNIGEDDNFVVKNLEITASKKFLNTSISIGDKLTVKENLTLNTNFGRIVVNSKIDGNVTVNSKAGSILINSSIGGDLEVVGSNPTVEVGTIPGGWRNKTSFTVEELNALTQRDIEGHVTLHNITDGGNIKVSGTIKQSAFISAPYVQFWANNILNSINCDSGANNIKVFGNIGISGTIENCNLNVGDGSLFVNNCYTTINKVLANKGDVYIANAFNDVTIESNNGDVFVNFDKNVIGKKLNVISNNRNIKATNISGLVNLFAQRGSIEATFVKISDGVNLIEAQRNVNVLVNDGQQFELTTKAKAGSIDVEMLPLVYKNFDGHTIVDGWKVRTDIVNGDGSTLTAKLQLKANGNDKITAKLLEV